MDNTSKMGKRLAAQVLDPQSRFLIIVGAAVALSGFIYAVVTLKAPVISQETSAVNQAPVVGFVPGGSVTSPFYERILAEDNQKRAKVALETGGSNIPTLQGRITVDADLVLPLPPTPLPRVATSQSDIPPPRWQDYSNFVKQPLEPPLRFVAVVVPPPPEPPIPPMPLQFMRIQADPQIEGAMRSQMEGIVGGNAKSQGHSSVIFYLPKSTDTQTDQTQAKDKKSDKEAKKKPALLVKTGEILYGRLINKAISTQPGPILGEIVSGKFRGYKLLGTFTRTKEVLTLNFENIIFPDGRKVGVNAVAIDPTDGTTGVATSVDRYIFERFVLNSASAFIGSFASAIAGPKQQTTFSFITIGGQATQQQQDERSTEESLFAGVSAAADVVTSELDNKSDDYNEPEVIVAQGTLFGLLFLDELREPPSEEEDQDQSN